MMRVISVGGGDHAIFQWRYLPDGSRDDDDDVDGGAYLESNSDDSDSEASDADELDSDVENVSLNLVMKTGLKKSTCGVAKGIIFYTLFCTPLRLGALSKLCGRVCECIKFVALKKTIVK